MQERGVIIKSIGIKLIVSWYEKNNANMINKIISERRSTSSLITYN